MTTAAKVCVKCSCNGPEPLDFCRCPCHQLAKLKLYRVLDRRPLRPRERKVWTHVYITLATSAEEAVAKVRDARDFNDKGTWSAAEYKSTTYSAGIYSDDPTPEEKAARDTTPKRERRIRS